MPPHLQRPTPLWEFPITLTLIGLVLLVGGWSLSTWRPPLSERALDQESQFDQLRAMSKESKEAELTLRLDRMRPMPPFELPGRLILFGGMALFVVGVVRMYRAPPGPPRDETPEPDANHAEEHGEAISEARPGSSSFFPSE